MNARGRRTQRREENAKRAELLDLQRSFRVKRKRRRT